MASTTTTTTGKEEEEEELLLPVLQQHHPTHHHPLLLLHSTNHSSISPSCRLCRRKILTTAEAYTCKKRCRTNIYYHRLCVEAPPQIDLHPLHPKHPLLLVHDRKNILCDACDGRFFRNATSFWCHECDFDLDIACALSTLSDEGGYQCGKTSEQITLPLHPHPLTSFTKSHDFVDNSDCYICKGSVKEDGYFCLQRLCEFVIHKGCIRDLYYADGTKAPRVYHGHPLEIFVEEDTGSRTCQSCGSDKSGEFIGCETCQVFYHRNCFQMPEILQYSSHHSDHTLVLFPDTTDSLRRCESCSIFMEDEIYYRCTSCEFFLHVGCASEVLAYYEEGMSAKLELSWHKHPLLLCHLTESASKKCDYCRDESIGPMYVCKKEDCRLILHKRCTEIESTITYPHHLDHSLTIFYRDEVLYKLHLLLDDGTRRQSQSCSMNLENEIYYGCTSCEFFVHFGCAFKVLAYYEEGMSAKIELSWHKHPLLLCHLTESASEDCDYCGDESIGPTYVCKERDCRFILHKRCTEIESTIRHPHHLDHPLTLCERDDDDIYLCNACSGAIKGLSFFCKLCDVKVDVKCAARFPTHKHYLHEHMLMRFEGIGFLGCHRCCTINNSPIFRCVACNFNLHEECMELPQVIRNDKIHWHPLTLHETFLEDDSGEYYCEHCEKTRDPRLGVYVCGQCHISLPRIYHIHCVISELGMLYEKKRLSCDFQKLKERIAEKEEEVRAIKENLKKETQNLEKVTGELDVLMREHNQILKEDSKIN